MEEFIFFGLILVFSILDGLARKRRQRQSAEAPDDAEGEGWDDVPSRPRGEVGTYEADTGSTLEPWNAPGSSTPAPGRVPTDLWEEIAALARGERQIPPREPEPPVHGSEPVGRGGLPARRSGTPPIRGTEVGRGGELTEHSIHRAHAGYGTDPSTRPTSLPPSLDAHESEDVSAVKSMLAGGRSQLRRAVILQETLGPPVSMREDGHL